MNRGEIDAAFASVLGDTYPGSRQTRRAVAKTKAKAAPEDEERWDAHPTIQNVDGRDVEFFYVGAVAVALGRRPNTIRRWLNDGTLPKERFRTNASAVKGSRRLWTRAQIEGMRRIAKEEGLFDGAVVTRTDFTVRVKELFRSLKGQAP